MQQSYMSGRYWSDVRYLRRLVAVSSMICIATGLARDRMVYFQAETVGISDFAKAAELAKSLGATHMVASAVEPSMWQWDMYGRKDPYPNWTMHRPSVFKFHVPDALKPYIPEDYTSRNLAALRARSEILKKHGLKAMFIGIGPSYFPEKAYHDHPSWRGPRCDQCRRATHAYYAPCIDNPEVRKMYVEAVTELCKACPFEFFDMMANDSAAGLCWVQDLYPGQNGPAACRNIHISDRMVSWLSVFQEGAAAAGGHADVNFNRYLSAGEVSATMPKLKPGQSIGNRTRDGASRTCVVGYPNRFAVTTFPVACMPAMTVIARQLQAAQQDGATDIHVALRGMDEVDAIAFLRDWMGNDIGKGPAARYVALEKTAARFVGEKRAPDLVGLWERIDGLVGLFSSLRTGGHVFLLGGVHQRWLTRPLTAFPGELKGEDRDYWRNYLFQAQDEEHALDYVDLQGHKWLSGYGGMFLVDNMVHDALKDISSASSLARSLCASAADPVAAKYLKGLVLKLRLYSTIVLNMKHYVDYADTLALTKEYQGAPPHDRTPIIRYQGDAPLRTLELTERAEIDNAVAMIGVLEEAQREGIDIIQTAPDDRFTNVMNLPPVPRLIREIRRKIAIMEEHRLDLARLYTTKNY